MVHRQLGFPRAIRRTLSFLTLALFVVGAFVVAQSSADGLKPAVQPASGAGPRANDAFIACGSPEIDQQDLAAGPPRRASDGRDESTVDRAGFEWQTATPQSEGFSSAKLQALWDALRARRTTALIVIRNDRIVLEKYADGWNASMRQASASMAKALVGGIALAVAMSDGLISLDDPAAKYVASWRNDARKSKITIRELGSHTSGLENAESDDLPHAALTGWKGAFWKREKPPNDPFTIARDVTPLVREPGSEMIYSNPGTAMLCYTITAALKGAPQDNIRVLLQTRVMRPIGLRDVEWSVGSGESTVVDGLSLVAAWGGASFTPRGAARVARLMLREGDWDGKQLINEKAVAQVTRDVGTPGPCGIGWWTNTTGAYRALPRDAFFASGAGHKIVLVVPSLSLIAVRSGDSLDAKIEPFDMTKRDETYNTVFFGPLVEAINDRARPPSTKGQG